MDVVRPGCAFRKQGRRLECTCSGLGGMKFTGPRERRPGKIALCGQRYAGDETALHCDAPTRHLARLPKTLRRFPRLTNLTISVRSLATWAPLDPWRRCRC